MRVVSLVILVSLAAAASRGAGREADARAGAPQAPAAAGTLRGRVDVQRMAAIPERRPSVADLASPAAAAETEMRPAVVFLEAPDVAASSELRARRADPPAGRARMDQRNETFWPHVLAINVGTTVDFPNNDRTYHNVFSLSKARRFDLGRYGKGMSEPVRFDQPGIVRVFCDIHSHMSAFVLVFNHSYHDTTDAEGRYRIDNIPPGTYTVTAWHEGAARDTRSVTIPTAGGLIDLDLLVR